MHVFAYGMQERAPLLHGYLRDTISCNNGQMPDCAAALLRKCIELSESAYVRATNEEVGRYSRASKRATQAAAGLQTGQSRA